MAGATIIPVPRAVDMEAHHYPRRWKRNMFFLYGGLALMAFQISRFALMCRVSSSFLSFVHFIDIWRTYKFMFINIYLIAINNQDWRVHGLVKQARSQESQILNGSQGSIMFNINERVQN